MWRCHGLGWAGLAGLAGLGWAGLANWGQGGGSVCARGPHLHKWAWPPSQAEDT